MSNLPPPVPLVADEPARKRSFFHHAANVAVGSLVLWLAVNALAASPALTAAREGQPMYLFAVSVARGLLLLSSFVCGVVALCGIGRHGRRKLLWKGLVATLVPMLLIGLAISGYLKYQRSLQNRPPSTHPR